MLLVRYLMLLLLLASALGVDALQKGLRGQRSLNGYIPSSPLEAFVRQCRHDLKAPVELGTFINFAADYCERPTSDLSSLGEIGMLFEPSEEQQAYSQLYNGSVDDLCEVTYPILDASGLIRHPTKYYSDKFLPPYGYRKRDDDHFILADGTGQKNDDPPLVTSNFTEVDGSDESRDDRTNHATKSPKKQKAAKTKRGKTPIPTVAPATRPTAAPASTKSLINQDVPDTFSPTSEPTDGPTSKPVETVTDVNDEKVISDNEDDGAPLKTLFLVSGSLAFVFGAAILLKRRKRCIATKFSVIDPVLDGDSSVSTEHSQVNNSALLSPKQAPEAQAYDNNGSSTLFELNALWKKPIAAIKGIYDQAKTLNVQAIPSLDLEPTGEVSETESLEHTGTDDRDCRETIPSTPDQEFDLSSSKSGKTESMGQLQYQRNKSRQSPGKADGYFVDETSLNAPCDRIDTPEEDFDLPRANQTLQSVTNKAAIPFVTKSAQNREAQQEDEALESDPRLTSFDQRPWRSQRQKRQGYDSVPIDSHRDFRRATTTAKEYEPQTTEADIEDDESLAFLNPEILQQFLDVDQILADGFKQFKEEDQLVSDEFEKLEAEMDALDESANKDSDEMSCIDVAKMSDAECINDANCKIQSSVASAQDVESKLERLPWSQDKLRSVYPIPQNSEDEDEELSDDDERKYDFRRLQRHFASNWYQKEGLLGVSEERTGDNFVEKPIASLLPPELSDEEENPDVSFSNPETALEPPSTKRRIRRAKTKRRRRKG